MANQIKIGSFLSYISIITNIVIGLIYTPYMIRMLGQSEYGLYSLTASVIAYLTVLDLGFGDAIIRYTAKYRAEGKTREQSELFGMFIFLYSIIGIIAFIIGLLLTLNAGYFFHETMSTEEIFKVKIMLWIMTFNIAFTFPMSIWGAIMCAYERFVFQKIVIIARNVLNPLVMVVLLSVGYKAIALVIITTIFNMFSLVANWLYCKRRLKIKVRFCLFNLGFIKEVCLYSFWIFLNVIMDRIYWNTGQFVLGIYQGTVAIAVYSLAIQLHFMYNSFSTAISSLLLPKVIRVVVSGNDYNEVSNFFIKVGRLQYIAMSFILTSFIIFGKPFIKLWAGQGYEDTYIISLLLFVPLTVPLIQNIGITILKARNQMKFRSVVYVIIALLSLLISIPLSKEYSGIGCAVATSIALVLGHIIIMNIYYKCEQQIDIVLFWKNIAKMSVVPGVIILIWLFNDNSMHSEAWDTSTLLIFFVIFSMLYLPLFFFFSMNQYERELFISPVLKLRSIIRI